MNQLIKSFVDELNRHTFLTQSGLAYANGCPPSSLAGAGTVLKGIFLARAKEEGGLPRA